MPKTVSSGPSFEQTMSMREYSRMILFLPTNQVLIRLISSMIQSVTDSYNQTNRNQTILRIMLNVYRNV